jgi:tRNA(Ile)-lysidine synthase TilS/MesJ
MYHTGMQKLAQSVLHYIRRNQLLKAGDRVGVAVSAGADSVALLRLLMELRKEIGIVLSVIHFNHKLRDTNWNCIWKVEMLRVTPHRST